MTFPTFVWEDYDEPRKEVNMSTETKHPASENVSTESTIEKKVRWYSTPGGWVYFVMKDGQPVSDKIQIMVDAIAADPDGFVAFAEAIRDALRAQEVIQRLKS